MDEKTLSINPKHAMGILRRYLHVLALLQNNKDPQDWNSNTLADLLSQEIDSPLSDKVIRGDIEKYIEGDLGLSIAKKKGARRMDLASNLNDETLLTLLKTYSDFIVHDSTRISALNSLITAKHDICLWLLARLHFAIVTRNKTRFDYTSNNNNRSTVTVHPYHIVCREKNIYLIGMRDSDGTVGQYYISRIENLTVLDADFDETIPTVEELYNHSLGGFIWDYDITEMTIRYKAERARHMINEFSSLDPVIKEDGKWHEMRFLVTNYEAVCRQLFFYGKDVVIVSPESVRKWMIDSLNDSLSMYKTS